MKEDKVWLTKTWMVCILAMVCCILWGSAFPCIKLGYRWWQITATDSKAQILFAGLRFTLAGILTLIIGSVIQKKVLVPNRDGLNCVIKLSIFQTILQYLFFYIGLANASGVKCSIINASNVFVAILIASLIFGQEKLNGRKIIGCFIGFAGVILINVNGASLAGGMALNGEGFIFISSVASAISSSLTKQYSKKHNPVMLSGYQFVIGGAVMILWGYFSGGRLKTNSPSCIFILIYLALVSAVAYSIWSILLKYNPVSKVAVFGFMNPIAGVCLSALLLQEKSQASGIIVILALALVSAGIYIVNRKKDAN